MANICKANPQSISSGKSELIRAVHIRLASFGGVLLKDEFTKLTVKCIGFVAQTYL